jgi:hypothetical protein
VTVARLGRTGSETRDAQLSSLGAAIVAALTLLAERLAAKQISEAEFRTLALAELAQVWRQASAAGAAQAQAELGLAAVDTGVDEATISQAAGWLDGLARLVVEAVAAGKTAEAVAGRIAMYASTATGAWEQGYTATVTVAYPNATWTWVAADDDATCEPCGALDGDTFTLADAPGLPGGSDFGEVCDGGPNCRCFLDLVDTGEQADTAEDAVAASGQENAMTIIDTQRAVTDAQANLADAQANVTASVAPDGTVTPGRWHAILAVEGVRTDDHREIAVGACQFPDLPVPLRICVEDEGGHYGAVAIGRIDVMERRDNAIYAEGAFGSDENGQLAELMVAEQTKRFISIDPRDYDIETVEVAVFPNDGIVLLGPDGEAEPPEFDWWDRYLSLTIGAATIVDQPAFPQAVICPIDVPLPDTPVADAAAADRTVLAAGVPVAPPADWFDDPVFTPHDGRMVQDVRGNWACPLTVTADGHVYGHIAAWGQEHIGMAGRNIRPPRSKAGYAYFRTGSVTTADGAVIPTGCLTMGCGHAADRVDHRVAAAHYDGGPGAVQMADVACGDDEYGVWVAGALRPTVTAEQVREFQALSPSGDWRRVAGNLELVAVTQVPVPGFPVPRSIVASADVGAWPQGPHTSMVDGEIVSLVAAGRVVADPAGSRFARLEAEVGVLRHQMAALARDRVAARLRAV